MTSHLCAARYNEQQRERSHDQRDERQELQQRLSHLGFYEGEADGKLGSKTREAVRNFQLRRGLVPDGYADVAVLRQLRTTR